MHSNMIRAKFEKNTLNAVVSLSFQQNEKKMQSKAKRR